MITDMNELETDFLNKQLEIQKEGLIEKVMLLKNSLEKKIIDSSKRSDQRVIRIR